jgi:hypothetical protein
MFVLRFNQVYLVTSVRLTPHLFLPVMPALSLNERPGTFARTCAPFTIVSRQFLLSCPATAQITLARSVSAVTIGVVPQYLDSLGPWDAIFSSEVAGALGDDGAWLSICEDYGSFSSLVLGQY